MVVKFFQKRISFSNNLPTFLMESRKAYLMFGRSNAQLRPQSLNFDVRLSFELGFVCLQFLVVFVLYCAF